MAYEFVIGMLANVEISDGRNFGGARTGKILLLTTYTKKAIYIFFPTA